MTLAFKFMTIAERTVPMLDYNFSNDFYKNIDAMIYTCGFENCAPGTDMVPYCVMATLSTMS